MHFHLLYIPSYIPQKQEGIHEYYENMLKQIEYADIHNWKGVWTSEHHSHDYGGMIPSNVLMGTAISQRTKNIRIGTGISVLPLNSPIHLAEQFAMLDHLSKGRVDVGIGRGFLRKENEALEVPVESSMKYFLESYEVMTKAWQSDYFSYNGDIWNYKKAKVLPKTYQSPHPPIWVAASRCRDTYKFAGNNGHNLMLNLYTRTDEEIREGIGWYYAALQEKNHDINSIKIGATQHLFVANTEHDAKKIPQEAFLNYLDAVNCALKSSYGDNPDSPLSAKKTMQRVSKIDYENLYKNKVTFGSPNRVLERIKNLQKLGITDLFFMPQFGNLDWDQSQSSVDLFTKEVMANI